MRALVRWREPEWDLRASLRRHSIRRRASPNSRFRRVSSSLKQQGPILALILSRLLTPLKNRPPARNHRVKSRRHCATRLRGRVRFAVSIPVSIPSLRLTPPRTHRLARSLCARSRRLFGNYPRARSRRARQQQPQMRCRTRKSPRPWTHQPSATH